MSRQGVPVGTVHGDEETKLLVMRGPGETPWELATLWIEKDMLRVELYGPGGHEVCCEYAIPMTEYQEKEEDE